MGSAITRKLTLYNCTVWDWFEVSVWGGTNACVPTINLSPRLETPLPPSGTESTILQWFALPAGQNGPLRDLQLRNKQQRLPFFRTLVFCFHVAKRRLQIMGAQRPPYSSLKRWLPDQPRVSVRRPLSPSPQENTVYCGQSCSSIWGHHLSLMGIFPLNSFLSHQLCNHRDGSYLLQLLTLLFLQIFFYLLNQINNIIIFFPAQDITVDFIWTGPDWYKVTLNSQESQFPSNAFLHLLIQNVQFLQYPTLTQPHN